MHAAVDEMARVETFRGYPPETGWDFLLEAIARHDFGERGVTQFIEKPWLLADLVRAMNW